MWADGDDFLGESEAVPDHYYSEPANYDGGHFIPKPRCPKRKKAYPKNSAKFDFQCLSELNDTSGLTIDDFIMRQDLGKGRFGRIREATWKGTQDSYAIKAIEIKEELGRDDNFWRMLKREIEIQTALDHPNVTKIDAWFLDNFNVYLVLELAKMDLWEHLNDQRKKHLFIGNFRQCFNENQMAHYHRQLVNAVEYMHSMNIAHRDIKPENVLVGEVVACRCGCEYGGKRHPKTRMLKLADFGWAINGGKENFVRKSFCGTHQYLPPEILDRENCRKGYRAFGVDVWCLGVLGFEILTGELPFLCSNDHNIYLRNIRNMRIRYANWVNQDTRTYLNEFLQKDERKRKSIGEILDLHCSAAGVGENTRGWLLRHTEGHSIFFDAQDLLEGSRMTDIYNTVYNQYSNDVDENSRSVGIDENAHVVEKKPTKIHHRRRVIMCG